MADEQTETGRQAPWTRVRRGGLFVLFSLVLLIPKALALRRRRKLWNGLRILLALAGGILIAIAITGSLGYPALIAGVLLIVLALVVSPAESAESVDAVARRLGALVVLNGGTHSAQGGKPVEVRLYLSPERLHVLDLRHRELLVIPVSAIASARVTEGEAETTRTLAIEWRGGKAEFCYQGFFAEHLAEVARRTVESRLLSKLRVLR
ncbi:MAG: hypothetical protein ACRD88_10095 [Terriglobia bacterium]